VDVLVDGHAHIYPFFNLQIALDAVFNALRDKYPTTPRIVCLAERHDCNVFDQLKKTQEFTGESEYKVEDCGAYLRVASRKSYSICYFLPGRQIVTAEKIEILALNSTAKFQDGVTAVDAVYGALDVGALPVVAWSPGKWFFQRRGVVERLLEKFGPKEIALGDTSLRPMGWTTPVLIREAIKACYKVLSGSDPLPLAGEETRLGSYMTAIGNGKLESTPDDRIGQLLLDQNVNLSSVGSRGSFFDVGKRISRNFIASRSVIT